MPANLIHIRAGLVLHDLEKVGMNFMNILLLLGLGFIALIPTLFKSKLEKIGEEKIKN
jgi:hypothetical protein